MTQITDWAKFYTCGTRRSNLPVAKQHAEEQLAKITKYLEEKQWRMIGAPCIQEHKTCNDIGEMNYGYVLSFQYTKEKPN